MTLDRLIVGIDTNGGERNKGSLPSQRVAQALSQLCFSHPYVDFVLFGRSEHATKSITEYHVPRNRVSIIECPAWAVGINEVEGSNKTEIRQKIRETSVHVMLDYLARNEIGCAYSMGETGFMIGHATNQLGRIPPLNQMKYAPLVAELPTRQGEHILFTDVGATVNTPVENVLTFGILCDVYCQDVLKKPEPRVAILSNGEESYKGNAFVLELAGRMHEYNRTAKHPLNFVGFIEGKHGIFEYKADIVLAEGFVGNTNLKTMEGIVEAFFGFVKDELDPHQFLEEIKKIPQSTEDIRKMGIAALNLAGLGSGYLMKHFLTWSGKFPRIKGMFNPDNYNAAPLLGLKYYMVKGHGNSTPNGIFNGLERTIKYCQSGAIEHIKERFNSE